MQQVYTLIQKEIRIELRSLASLASVFLYVLCAVFIVFFSVQKLTRETWVVLYWVIGLFAAINTVTRSFFTESTQRNIYYYQLHSPWVFILAKIIYNFIFLILILGLTCFVFSLFSHIYVPNLPLFLGIITISSFTFSTIFSFVSALVSKIHNKGTLSVVMSFPLTIGVLMLIVRLSIIAMGIFEDTSYFQDIIYLGSIGMMLIGLTFLLFPFVWKE